VALSQQNADTEKTGVIDHQAFALAYAGQPARGENDVTACSRPRKTGSTLGKSGATEPGVAVREALLRNAPAARKVPDDGTRTLKPA